MIRFGTIGTNWITDKFIEAARMDSRFELSACYSRTLETAQAFAKKYNVKHCFTDIDEMAESGLIDAVYIASPNLYHYQQSIQFLKNKIAVLCEKPLATDSKLVIDMVQKAKDHNTLLMHAIKNLFEPRLQLIEDLLPQLGEIRLVIANRCRYSSRYNEYLAGNIPNTFNPRLGNGAIMDFGIYLVQPLVYFFGKPKAIVANSVMLDNGIDGAGTIIAHYDQMQAVLNFSKISTSPFATEIQGEKGTLYIRKEEKPSVRLALHGQPVQDVVFNQDQPDMFYEVKAFMDLLDNGSLDSPISRHQDVITAMEIIDDYKEQVGLKFK